MQEVSCYVQYSPEGEEVLDVVEIIGPWDPMDQERSTQIRSSSSEGVSFVDGYDIAKLIFSLRGGEIRNSEFWLKAESYGLRFVKEPPPEPLARWMVNQLVHYLRANGSKFSWTGEFSPWYCSVTEFQINGIRADSIDLGYPEDRAPYDPDQLDPYADEWYGTFKLENLQLELVYHQHIMLMVGLGFFMEPDPRLLPADWIPLRGEEGYYFGAKLLRVDRLLLRAEESE